MNHETKAIEARGSNLGRLVRFVLIGSLSSLIYLCLVTFCVEFISFSNSISVAVSYVICIPASYLGHRRITFKSNARLAYELPKFLLLHLFNIAISICGMFATVNGFDLPYWMGALSATILVPISTFIIMHLWVFIEIEPEH